ncbi:MAG: hypothetical protein ACD_78C00061G0005, partial [uncultured bacterium (gcode 4)]
MRLDPRVIPLWAQAPEDDGLIFNLYSFLLCYTLSNLISRKQNNISMM